MSVDRYIGPRMLLLVALARSVEPTAAIPWTPVFTPAPGRPEFEADQWVPLCVEANTTLPIVPAMTLAPSRPECEADQVAPLSVEANTPFPIVPANTLAPIVAMQLTPLAPGNPVAAVHRSPLSVER